MTKISRIMNIFGVQKPKPTKTFRYSNTRMPKTQKEPLMTFKPNELGSKTSKRTERPNFFNKIFKPNQSK